MQCRSKTKVTPGSLFDSKELQRCVLQLEKTKSREPITLINKQLDCHHTENGGGSLLRYNAALKYVNT